MANTPLQVHCRWLTAHVHQGRKLTETQISVQMDNFITCMSYDVLHMRLTFSRLRYHCERYLLKLISPLFHSKSTKTYLLVVYALGRLPNISAWCGICRIQNAIQHI